MKRALLSHAIALFLLLWAASAWSATITVNSTADTVANDGVCTLREAIIAANTNTASGALSGECVAGQAFPVGDTIFFNIPGPGVHTISPTTPLPVVTDQLIIDGYSQPGSSSNTLATGSNAVLLIELSGANAGAGADGLRISASTSQVRGLVINRFSGRGILLQNGDSNLVGGNFIGTNPSGTAAGPGNGGIGLLVTSGSSNNRIGFTAPGERNLISANGGTGVQISTTGNRLQGNLIGTNAAGDAALGNAGSGVFLAGGADNTTVGGTLVGERNVISGNSQVGLMISASGNIVQGNFIGTNAGGTAAIGNGTFGVNLNIGSNTIGGTVAGAGNVISGNGTHGINIVAAAASCKATSSAPVSAECLLSGTASTASSSTRSPTATSASAAPRRERATSSLIMAWPVPTRTPVWR